MSDKDLRNQKNATKEVHYPDNSKESKVPPGVKDEEAWYKWQEMRESTIMKEEFRIIETSDPFLKIDLCIPAGTMRKRMGHLPQEEQATIEKRAKAVKVVQGKIAALKQKAFGIKQKGLYSMSESILDPQTGELIEYFGRFYSIEEVHKIVVQEWGYPVSKDLIGRFRKRHLDKIKERQEEYKRDYSDIRLGYKRSRLEELEWIYKIRKSRYEETQSQSDEKLMLQIIKQIKDEVEKDVLRIEGDINHKVETTINLHVQQDLFQSMTINDIIIGRIAARQGLNAAYLVERLHKSFYSRYSGFGDIDKHTNDEEVSYPSALVYNWDAIEKKHKEDKAKLEESKKPTSITDAKIVSDADVLKESLIAKLKKKQGDINESQSRVEDQE